MRNKSLQILIILAFTLIYTGCKQEIDLLDVKNIQSMQLVPAKFITQISPLLPATTEFSQTEAQSLAKLIRDAIKTTPVVGYIPKNEIQIITHYADQTVRNFYIDFDLELKKAMLTHELNSYSISENLYKEFIQNAGIAPYLGITFTPPALTELQMPTKMSQVKGHFEYPYFNGTKAIEIQGDSMMNPTSENAWNQTLADFKFEFDTPPDQITQNIYDFSNQLVSSAVIADYTLIDPNIEGAYTIELVATWNGFFKGEATYWFSMNIDLPVEFSMMSSTAQPGDLFVIIAKNVNENQVLKVSTPLFEELIAFVPYNNEYIGLIPCYNYAKPDSYAITAEATEADGTTTIFSSTLEVAYKEFAVQNLTISSSAVSLQTDSNQASDQLNLDQARANPIFEKLWEGTFIQPTEGVISTEYGQIRYTNNNPTPSRHNGIDFANVKGTPVYAANTGRVVLAKALFITGNTIIIDHGMGIFSYYNHLDELLVEVGDDVIKSDLIGKMGTTGYSTGSHLHFSISKFNIRLNPWTFMKIDYLGF